MATSGGNFVSIAHLEIPLLIKMLMCQILIFPAVYASVYRCICMDQVYVYANVYMCICMDRVYMYMRVFICVYSWIEFICVASVYRCICMD